MGVWSGPTSLAYLFLKLSETHPDLKIEGKPAQDWCNAYLECGQDKIASTKEGDQSGWGIANEYLAFNTVKACATKDLAYVSKVEDGVTNGFDCLPEDNEVLAGRAGTLSLLRMIKRWVPEAAARMDKCMVPLIDHILASKPWTFHKHTYIGAAHGIIGIITQVALSDPERVSGVEAELAEMLDLQFEDGHWNITPHPTLGGTDVVEFCHGAPGFVISLAKIRPLFSEEMQKRIDVAITRGRQEIWEKGLLAKEPSLCHGIVGNMLALEDWKQRDHFMAHATMEKIEEGKKDGRFIASSDPYGLLWGEAGKTWGWMVINSRKELGYPSYTDI
jgi:hypothetical protein